MNSFQFFYSIKVMSQKFYTYSYNIYLTVLIYHAHKGQSKWLRDLISIHEVMRCCVIVAAHRKQFIWKPGSNNFSSQLWAL